MKAFIFGLILLSSFAALATANPQDFLNEANSKENFLNALIKSVISEEVALQEDSQDSTEELAVEQEDSQRKLVLSDGTTVSQKIEDPKIVLEITTGPKGSAGGASYIRWGRTTCPDTEGTELLYKGVAAGPHYTQKGGGSNYLCLPEQPQFLAVTAGAQNARSKVYGAEYETYDKPPALANKFQHNVPCASCYNSVRSGKIMIPAQVECPKSWTREYYGYLMSEYHGHFRMSYECVDKDAESIPGSAKDINGALFYFAEAVCHGLKCPPYVQGNELACVVCTK